MAENINDLVPSGQRILFGCTLKNLNIDFGIDASNYTATVIEDEGQRLTLRDVNFNDGNTTLTNFNMGSLNITAIATSWEEILTDINGNKIISIRMDSQLRDPLLYIDLFGVGTNIAEIPTLIGGRSIYIPLITVDEQRNGVSAKRILDIISSFEFNLLGMRIRYDFSDFDLDNLDSYKIFLTNAYKLQELLTEISLGYNVNYILHFNFENEILNVSISLLETKEIDPNITDGFNSILDFLKNRHDGKIISESKGSESRGYYNEELIYPGNQIFRYLGGNKQDLYYLNGSGYFRQFWGFDNDNNLLNDPAVAIEGKNQLYHVDIEILRSFINNKVVGDVNGISSEEYNGIKKLSAEFWGRKFIIDPNFYIITSGVDSNGDFIIEPSFFSWPDNFEVELQNNIMAQNLLRQQDGRWSSFIKLPDISVSGTWSNSIISSPNVIRNNDDYYMKIGIERINNYFIATLPFPLVFIEENNNLNKATIISSAYIATSNKLSRYGTFTIFNDAEFDENDVQINAMIINSQGGPVPIRLVFLVNDNIIPWNFSQNSFDNTIIRENIIDYLIKQEPSRRGGQASVINSFGSIEVADIPVEEPILRIAFPDGKNVTRINISFDTNGIKTRYYIEPFDTESNNKNAINSLKKSASNLANQLRKLENRIRPLIPPGSDAIFKPEEQIEKKIKELEQRLEDLKKDNQKADEQLKLSSPDMEYIYQKPEGGLGVIEGKESVTGPFYFVRRLNYADIDPQTFAGGLNITKSYFNAEWHNVRNLAEPADSFGYLLPGTRVTVSIFSEGVDRPQVPYIEQNPQVFAPPIPE